MYVQGEYNNDWERVGDEESVSGIFRIFANFEPPQNARDKNFRSDCKVRHVHEAHEEGGRGLGYCVAK